MATGGACDGFPVGAADSHVVTAAFDATAGAVRWSAVWDGRPDATDNGNDVAFSPDGSKVFIGGITTGATNGDLNYLTLAYGVRRGKQLWARVYSGLNTGGSDAQYGLAVSPSGDKVYVTGESVGAREYDIDYATVAYEARSGRQLSLPPGSRRRRSSGGDRG